MMRISRRVPTNLILPLRDGVAGESGLVLTVIEDTDGENTVVAVLVGEGQGLGDLGG